MMGLIKEKNVLALEKSAKYISFNPACFPNQLFVTNVEKLVRGRNGVTMKYRKKYRYKAWEKTNKRARRYTAWSKFTERLLK